MAVVMGEPREQLRAANGRRGDDGKDYLRGVAARLGARIVGDWDWVHAPGGQVQVRMSIPGHEGARQALARLADRWREHLPVLADWLAARGLTRDVGAESIRAWADRRERPGSLADFVAESWSQSAKSIDMSTTWGVCPSVDRALAECPALPVWIEAGLAGEREPNAGLESFIARNGLDSYKAIDEHMPAVLARLRTMWEAVTIECGACRARGRRESTVVLEAETERDALAHAATLDGDHEAVLNREGWNLIERRDCPDCAGLGRVRSEVLCKG